LFKLLFKRKLKANVREWYKESAYKCSQKCLKIKNKVCPFTILCNVKKILYLWFWIKIFELKVSTSSNKRKIPTI
jgi:hypothetical protein